MDWGNDYFTFSDTNIEYIWRFLNHVHEQGWLYLGHRSTEWCPRCGTSISAHELRRAATTTGPIRRSSSASRSSTARASRSSSGRRRPWTLPANVAAAVKPDAEYGLRENGDWVAVARYPDATFTERRSGAELVGLRYDGPFDELAPAAAVEHRVIPWDEVTLDDGTGIVHIAPGCGAEDFELSRVHDLDGADARSTSPAASTTTTAGSTASPRSRPPSRSSATSTSAGCSSRRGCTSTATRTAGAATRR